MLKYFVILLFLISCSKPIKFVETDSVVFETCNVLFDRVTKINLSESGVKKLSSSDLLKKDK